MKNFSKFICFFLTITIVTCLSFSTTTLGYTSPTSLNTHQEYLSKIHPDIFTLSDRDNDKYSVMVLFGPLNEEEINNELFLRTEKNPDIYENTSYYEQTIVPSLLSDILSSKKSDFELDAREQNEMLNQLIDQDISDYKKEKRGIVSEYCVSQTKTFLQKYHINQNNIIYQSPYTSTLIINATQDLIASIAEDALVKSIVPFINISLEPDCPYADIRMNTDIYNGTKSSDFNSGDGYLGDGVKIGVIECSIEQLDLNNPQIANANVTIVETGMIGPSNNSHGYHATKMVSLIAGQEYIINNKRCEGVVPNAEIYLTNASNNVDLLNAFNELCSAGVSIISMSGGFFREQTYTEYVNGVAQFRYYIYDEIDRLIQINDVTYVCSAGNLSSDLETITENDYLINAVAQSYNSIVVGAVDCSVSASEPFSVRSDSCYLEDAGFVNKPDIVGPGTSIYCVGENSTLTTTGQTSAAAALVAGVVAQMHQCRPTLKNDFTLTKALLLGSANADLVSSKQNPYKTDSLLREKSGAGFVDAKLAVTNTLNQKYQVGTFTQFSTGSPIGYNNTVNINLTKNKTFVATIVFDKKHFYNNPQSINDGVLNIDDLDLQLLFNSQVVDWSSASNENVEIIIYNVTTTGTYTLKINGFEMNAETGGRTIPFAVVWYEK